MVASEQRLSDTKNFTSTRALCPLPAAPSWLLAGRRHAGDHEVGTGDEAADNAAAHQGNKTARPKSKHKLLLNPLSQMA